MVPVAVLFDHNVPFRDFGEAAENRWGFPFAGLPVKTTSDIHGDTHEKWKKEASLDIFTGS
jgi:hypothetical protein